MHLAAGSLVCITRKFSLVTPRRRLGPAVSREGIGTRCTPWLRPCVGSLLGEGPLTVQKAICCYEGPMLIGMRGTESGKYLGFAQGGGEGLRSVGAPSHPHPKPKSPQIWATILGVTLFYEKIRKIKNKGPTCCRGPIGF